jgi:hypothetical protein
MNALFGLKMSACRSKIRGSAFARQTVRQRAGATGINDTNLHASNLPAMGLMASPGARTQDLLCTLYSALAVT